MKKRMTIMVIALFIVFGGIIGFNLFKQYMIKRYFATFEPPAVTISSVTAIKKNWRPRISAVGNFVAINGVEVNSEASGNVVKIHFDSGQYIDAGKPLIDIDDRVDQTILQSNQAQLALRDISYKRQIDLFKKGATPSSSVDEAKANLQQAQATVDKTQVEIKQKHITTPFAGKLGIRQVNLGQYITPGQTSIVSLQSMDPLFLEFYLPEQQFKRLHLNQPIQFAIEELSNVIFEGKITAINSKVDPNTHNILVQATLPNCPADALKNPKESPLIKMRREPDGDKTIVSCFTDINTKNRVSRFVFIPGMFAAITIEQPPIPDVVIVPSTAISYSLYGNSVFVIEKTGKDKEGKDILTVKRVFVSTGEQEGNYTVINSGVKAGDVIVSSGELKLQNGTRVIINNSVELKDVKDPDELGQ